MRTVRNWVGETVGGLPRPFWYIWTNTLINRLGSFVVILLAIYLTQNQHFSPTYTGFVIGLWGVGGAIGTLLGGVFADRWGRKKTFLTALYSSATMTLILGFTHGQLAVTIVVLLLGLASEAARPAMSALMIDVVGPKDRLRAFTLNYWVINLGFAFSATIAGLVAGLNYGLIFGIDAAATVAAATLVAVKVREPVRPSPLTVASPSAAAGPAAARSRGLISVFTDRVFISFVGVNVLVAMIFTQYRSTLPITMANDGLSSSTYGSVIALNGVLIVLGQLFMTRLLRRLPHSRGHAIAAVVIGVGFGLNAFAHTAGFYAVAVCVWTLGEMLNAPSNSATNAELSPADMRGRYQGAFSLSWSAANFIAPILGGAILQYAGDTTLWLSCLGVALVAAALHLLSGPARERRAAELREPVVTAAPALTADAAVDPEPELVPTATGPPVPSGA